jgi:hypothetical protein
MAWPLPKDDIPWYLEQPLSGASRAAFAIELARCTGPREGTSMSRRTLGLGLVWLGVWSSTCSADLIIADYSPQRNDRYYQGADKAFVAQGYDLSAVGKTGNALTENDAPWATLISPHFALTARHFAATGTVTFFPGNDPTATPVTATVTQLYAVPGTTPGESDLELVRFGTAVTGVNSVAIAQDDESALLNKQIFVYGQKNRVGTNNIDFFGLQTGITGAHDTYSMYYAYNPTNGNPNEAELNNHDSGGPSFVVGQGNQLALVGTHTFVGTDDTTHTDFSGDTFVPHYLPELQTLITSLDTQFGYNDTLRIVSVVPEPSSMVLTLVGSVGLFGFARRARRRIERLSGVPVESSKP